MRRLLAGTVAVAVVGAAGGLGTGAATAAPAFGPADSTDYVPSPVGQAAPAETVYALGGARAPGIPWYDYTYRAGDAYFPHAQRDVIDYPAGAPFNWVPEMFAEGPRDNVSIGVAADAATNNLDAAIKHGTGPRAAVGLSQGTLALDNEQVRLANDPTAPPPDQLTFTTIGNPTGRHAFGQSFLSGIFGPGSYVPIIDYTMPQQVDSQYDTNKVVAAYDGLADFPDRPDNIVAMANAFAAGMVSHTPAAFTGPDDVPPQNIRTTVNSKGAKTTTYLIPVNRLPLTMPLRHIGLSEGFVDQIDAVLQPMVDAGYSRNDNPATKPVSVDPVNGMDPIAVLDPATRDSVEDTFATIRGIIGPIG